MFVYIQAIRCLVNGCVSFFLNLIGQRQLRRLAIFISTFVSQLSLILSNKHGCPCSSCSIPIQKKCFMLIALPLQARESQHSFVFEIHFICVVVIQHIDSN
jgi:hypothetical protein